MANTRIERQFLEARCGATGRIVTLTQRTVIRTRTSEGVDTFTRQTAQFFDAQGRRLRSHGALLRHDASGAEYRIPQLPTRQLRWMAPG